MKKYYWFVILFIGWSIGSGLWYLYGVKGVINADPHYFDPHIRLLAIVEILVMLLIACLLGYGIAWALNQEALDRQSETTEEVIHQNNLLQSDNEELKNQVSLWHDKHQQEISACHQRLSEANSEKENLQTRLNELEVSLAQTRQEFLLVKTQHQQLENESGTLRYKTKQLEFQNQELEETQTKLQSEIASLQSAKHERSLSDHPFVRPTEPDEKDDLTKIKGIGPFIEKRLNMIGIYTFQQLGDLTPELIDRVGAAIEFFPHRIVRDNWVGQARSFVK